MFPTYILLAVIFAILFGKEAKSEPTMRAVFFLIVGTIFTMAALLIGEGLKQERGSPFTEIGPGTYKVAFVYPAGKNVSLGIEKPEGNRRQNDERADRLYLYQFPMKDFEGDIPLDAHKLVAYRIVTNEGTFNRYKLGYNIVQLQ